MPGSFGESLGNVSEDPLRSVLIAAGAVFLIVLLGRIFWRQLKKLWAKAKQGGVILSARGSTSHTRFSLFPFVALQARGHRDLPGGL